GQGGFLRVTGYKAYGASMFMMSSNVEQSRNMVICVDRGRGRVKLWLASSGDLRAVAGRRRHEVVAKGTDHRGSSQWLSNNRRSQQCLSNIRRWIRNDTRVSDVLFALSDTNELASLLRAAGFRDVAIQQPIGAVALLQSCRQPRPRANVVVGTSGLIEEDYVEI